MIEAANDVLAGADRVSRRADFRRRSAGDGEAIAVEQAFIQKHFHERGQAADADKRGHDVFAAGPKVGEDGNAFADFGEVVEVEFDTGAVGDGEEMEDGVGRTTEGDDDGDGVFEGLAGEDIAGADAEAEEAMDGGAGAHGVLFFRGGDGGLRGAVGEAHAEGLDGAGHGVGGVHAAAGTGAGDGAGFELLEIGVGHFAGSVGAHGLEDGDDVDVAFLEAAGENGAAVDEDGGAIEAGDGHQATGHVFVASANGNEAIEELAAHDGFDGIGDDFAGDEGVFHALRAHGDAVGDGDGVKDERLATGLGAAFRGGDGELVDVDVAGRDLAPGGGDADLGFLEIGAVEADGVKHGAALRALGGVDEVARPVAMEGGAGLGGLFRGRFHEPTSLPGGGGQ